MVGQTQYFENNDNDWEPVHTLYNDILLKTYKIHELIFNVLEEHVKCVKQQPSILLVTILEFLTRVEILDTINITSSYNGIFFKFLYNQCEKIRMLSAKCFARFHNFYEIPNVIHGMFSILFKTNNLNFQHGLILAIYFMLKKYECDARFIIMNEKNDFFNDIKNMVNINYLNHCSLINNFYIKSYWIDLLILLDLDMYSEFIIKSMFDKDINDYTNIKEHIPLWINDNTNNCHNIIGYDRWKRKMLKIYFNLEFDIELEI